jgi:hypothetical protein
MKDILSAERYICSVDKMIDKRIVGRKQASEPKSGDFAGVAVTRNVVFEGIFGAT